MLSPSGSSKFLDETGRGPEEARAIAKVYCEDRDQPLLIDTVISNLGHPEGVSDSCSSAKAMSQVDIHKLISYFIGMQNQELTSCCVERDGVNSINLNFDDLILMWIFVRRLSGL